MENVIFPPIFDSKNLSPLFVNHLTQLSMTYRSIVTNKIAVTVKIAESQGVKLTENLIFEQI
jgi:hypothetical protein